MIIGTMMINDNHQLIIGMIINIIKKTALLAGFHFSNVDHYDHGADKVMIIKTNNANQMTILTHLLVYYLNCFTLLKH